jgi:putative DNA primase/helicase
MIVFAVPNHANTVEQAADFEKETGLKAAIWRGLEQMDPERPAKLMCLESKLSKATTSSGGAVRLKDVCAVCPSRTECGYNRQRHQDAKAWFVTHALLFHQKPKGIPPTARLIIDESILSSAISQYDLDLYKLDDRAVTRFQYIGSREWGVYNDHPLNQERQRVLDAFRNAPDGPLHRDTIAGLSCSDYHRRCANWEWKQRINQKFPKDDIEGIMAEITRTSGTFTRLLPMMWEMIAEFQDSGEEQTQRIELARNEKGHRVIRMNRKEEIRAGWRAPTFHLDATPQMAIVRELFGDAEMVADIDVAAPHQTITRVMGQKFSKAWMIPSEKASEKRNNSRRNNALRLSRFIEVQAPKFSSIGVICNKGLEKIFKEVELPDNGVLGHFNKVKGINRFEDVDCLIIIGRTQPDRQISLRLARILSGRWDCEELADDIAWTICEAELLNGALGRARGIRRTRDNPVEVFLLNDIELPIRIDREISWNDIQPGPLELMAARGVVLDCKPGTRGLWPVVAAVLADVYASADAARKDFSLRSSRGETSIVMVNIDVSPRERSKLRLARIKAIGRRNSIQAWIDLDRATKFVEVVKFTDPAA